MDNSIEWTGNDTDGYESSDWRFRISPDGDGSFSVKDYDREEWIAVGESKKDCFQLCEAIHQEQIQRGW